MLDRTILHDFESALCYWVFGYIMTSHMGALLRTIFGPMSEFYCWWIIFCRNAIANGMQFCLDFNMIFRVSIPCNQLILQVSKISILNDTTEYF